EDRAPDPRAGGIIQQAGLRHAVGPPGNVAVGSADAVPGCRSAGGCGCPARPYPVPASRRVMREVKENAHTAAVLLAQWTRGARELSRADPGNLAYYGLRLRLRSRSAECSWLAAGRGVLQVTA